MATIQFKKGDEYLFKVAAMEAALKEELIGSAIYGAAGILTDEIRSQLDAIPSDEKWGTSESPTAGPNKYQKEALLRSLGIAEMQDDGTGFLNVKIGFDGYNGISSFEWPEGQPNQMVARSVERGTYWMKANPFMKRAAAKSRKRAIAFMKKTIDEGIEKIMRG